MYILIRLFLTGDQVLEWNGEPLTGKRDEEISQIISKPSCEVELVIKPYVLEYFELIILIRS